MRALWLVSLLVAAPAAADPTVVIPNFFAEAGTITHWLEPRLDTTAMVQGTAYRVMAGPERGGTAAVGGEARVGIALGPHVLLGAELEVAGLIEPSITAARTTGGAALPANATLAGMTGFAGARLPLGPVELTGELHAGMHALSIGGTPGHFVTENDDVIDARIRAELFVHHGLAIGAFLGSEVTRTDLIGGVSVVFYNCRPGVASLAGCRRPAPHQH